MKMIELLNYIKSIRKQEEVSEEISKKIIAILENNFKKLRHELKRSELSRFLYYTCHKFNRLSIPTNYYHLNEEYNYFKRYIKLFEKVENGFLDNILTLKVDLLTWDLLNQEDKKAPINYDYYVDSINDLYNKISCLSSPKRKEFIEHYERFINLFSGIKNRNIYTHMLLPISYARVKLI